MLQEAVGYTEKANACYDELITKNLADSVSYKRKISILRVKIKIFLYNFIYLKFNEEKQQAVIELNRYLENNMTDSEAWLELADIYLENLKYL